MARNLTVSSVVCAGAPPSRSLVLYSLVAFLTTCRAFDATFLDNTAFLGQPHEEHRTKRDASVPHLQDFEGDLDVLTTLELEHGAFQVSTNHTVDSPQYMLDLYSSLETGKDLVHPSPKEKEAIIESDTVRSFTATVRESNTTSGTNYTSECLANFRVNMASEVEERVRLAELRILLKHSWRKSTLEVALHHWALAPCPRDSHLFECFEKQLLISRMLPTHRHDDYDGREVFDVTEELRHWFTESPTWRGEYELEIRTVRRADQPGDLDEEEDASTSLAEDSYKPETAISLTSHALEDVVLVVFSQTLQPVKIVQDAESSSKVRKPRSTSRTASKKKYKKTQSSMMHEQERLIQEKLLREIFAKKQERGLCRRVSMEVSFYESFWSRWIIYPKQFDAYKCAGRCSGPLGSKDNPSNHAIMQNMVREATPDRAPEPCCIPTRLSPISMIYQEHGSIIMKHHEDMVVEQCGCR